MSQNDKNIALVELEEKEYIILNQLIDKKRKTAKTFGVSYAKDVKLNPSDVSNLEADLEEKYMLIEISYNDPSHLFDLGRDLEIELLKSKLNE